MGFKFSVYNEYKYVDFSLGGIMKHPTSCKKRFSCTFQLYRTISLVLIAIAVLLRTLNLFLYYEADIGYYRQGAWLPIVLRAALMLSTILLATLPFFLEGKVAPIPKPHAASSALAITVGVVFAVTALLRYCSSAIDASRHSILLFLMGGFAATYFVLLGLNKLSPLAALITGFGAILWFASVLVSSYFDVYVAMNAPTKVALLLACLGGMLLMLGEMRLLCGAHKKRFYLFALSSSTLYLGVSSIPNLIADAAGLLPARDLAFADLPILALGLFGIIRLLGPFGQEEKAEEAEPEGDQAEPIQDTPDNTDC